MPAASPLLHDVNPPRSCQTVCAADTWIGAAAIVAAKHAIRDGAGVIVLPVDQMNARAGTTPQDMQIATTDVPISPAANPMLQGVDPRCALHGCAATSPRGTLTMAKRGQPKRIPDVTGDSMQPKNATSMWAARVFSRQRAQSPTRPWLGQTCNRVFPKSAQPGTDLGQAMAAPPMVVLHRQ